MLYNSDTFFNDILQEVIYAESEKKELSQEILLAKSDRLRQKLIYRFLRSDLNKHAILEQAAMLAIETDAYYLLQQLELFYNHCQGEGLLEKIRTEISHDERYLKTIEKALKDAESISFVDRRLIREINKYVIKQARYYCKLSSRQH